MPISIQAMDPKSMYRVHQYTDDKAGTIYEKIPIVKTDKGYWDDDPMRLSEYSGQTYINSQPLNFPIHAATLSEAIERFASTVSEVIQQLQSKVMQDQLAHPIGRRSGLIIDGGR